MGIFSGFNNFGDLLMDYKILQGNALDRLKELPDESVNCVVTSPPYWGLRDYGTAKWEGGEDGCDHSGVARRCDKEGRTDKQSTQKGSSSDKISRNCLHCGAVRIDDQIGLEETPELFISNLVAIFSEVKRVLRNDGTLWLNLGDSYTGSGKGGNPIEGKQATNKGSQSVGCLYGKIGEGQRDVAVTNVTRNYKGIAPKNLVGIPWRTAFALQENGFYLRQDIIWSKPNPMPESVTDRCTKSHEYIFLLSKNQKYYFNNEAIKEPTITKDNTNRDRDSTRLNNVPGRTRMAGLKTNNYDMKNKRSVWTVNTQPFKGAHFAVFPEKLITPCILAGCPENGTVLDPFNGSGTTGVVALRNLRNYIGIELNPEYVELSHKRISDSVGLFAERVA